jgi:hypothetical protein
MNALSAGEDPQAVRAAYGTNYARLAALKPIFPPNPKRQKPVKELNLLNKPF